MVHEVARKHSRVTNHNTRYTLKQSGRHRQNGVIHQAHCTRKLLHGITYQYSLAKIRRKKMINSGSENIPAIASTVLLFPGLGWAGYALWVEPIAQKSTVDRDGVWSEPVKWVHSRWLPDTSSLSVLINNRSVKRRLEFYF